LNPIRLMIDHPNRIKGCRVAEADGSIGRTGDEHFPVRSPGEGQDTIFVSDQGMDKLAVAFPNFPNVNGLIITRGRNLLSGRRIGNAGNSIRSITQGIQPLPGSDVPDFYTPVLRTGRQMPAIRAESYGENGVNMILEIFRFLPRDGVPEFHHFVIAAGSNELSVRTPSNRIDAILVAQ